MVKCECHSSPQGPEWHKNCSWFIEQKKRKKRQDKKSSLQDPMWRKMEKHCGNFQIHPSINKPLSACVFIHSQQERMKCFVLKGFLQNYGWRAFVHINRRRRWKPVVVRTSRSSQHLKHKQNAKHPTRPFQRLVIGFILSPGGMPYLYEMDEGSENGTAEHVVFFWLLPKKRKVLNQAAHVRSNLEEKRGKVKHWS